jgi:hypothetical protein
MYSLTYKKPREGDSMPVCLDGNRTLYLTDQTTEQEEDEKNFLRTLNWEQLLKDFEFPKMNMREQAKIISGLMRHIVKRIPPIDDDLSRLYFFIVDEINSGRIKKQIISDNVLNMYPVLKEKNVGLGVTNITLDYLEGTNRFEFTEDKEEIKLKMVKQFQASNKGFTENKLDGKGKIKLAKFFVYIEVYDFSVDEQETFVAGKKQLEVTTRLGLQVRFVDAESGQVRVGSGLGEATQYGQSFLKSIEMKFAQSTVGISTRKALETGCSRVITRMIKDGVFEK